MARRDIIVIGASAGGIEALRSLLESLPAGLPASIFAVLHLPTNRPSRLPMVLSRPGGLQVKAAEHDEEPRPGVVYLAPSNSHLVFKNQRMFLGRGPLENGFRPAIDPLFRTAAKEFGARVIAIILSGALDDGTAGLIAVHKSGGKTAAQDPAEALFPDMPVSAIENARVDEVLPIAGLAKRLQQWIEESIAMDENEAPETDGPADKSEGELVPTEGRKRSEQAHVYGCPDCGGALWEIEEGALLRYECRVGHAYSAESFALGQKEALEAAFWTVIRTLEDSSAASRRILQRSKELGYHRAAARASEQLNAAQESLVLVRRALLQLGQKEK